MTTRSMTSRAAICLGAASIASVVFALAERELHFIALPTPAIVVTLVLGATAIAAGWLASRALVLVAATGFLAAAVTQVATQTAGASIANGSNGSTAGLWLGLGVGLLAAGLTRDPQQQSSGSA